MLNKTLCLKLCSLFTCSYYRWLSCYDVTISTLRMFEALQIFYYGFLPTQMRLDYKSQLVQLYRKHDLSEDDRKKIRGIHETLKVKKLTDDGHNRKKRIYEKVLYCSAKTLLILHLYKSALPLLKSYVVLFQTKAPMIHKAHDEQEKLFRQFLACYVKEEYLVGCNARQLKEMNLDNPKLYENSKDIFIGSAAAQIVKQRGNKDKTVEEFLHKAGEAYKACGKCLQQKLPLTNKTLQALSAVDPEARGHSVTCKYMKQLKDLLPVHLSDEDRDAYDIQVQTYQTDSLPIFDNKSHRIDEWYQCHVFHRHPVLAKVIKAGLCIFHGPQIESSFSIMSDIVDKHAGRMNMETFSAIQTVKHYLLTRSTDALTAFKDPNPRLTRNMFSAAGAYKATKKAATKKAEVKLTTKAAFKRKLITEDKAAQVKFVAKKRKDARNKALETLAAAKKAKKN